MTFRELLSSDGDSAREDKWDIDHVLQSSSLINMKITNVKGRIWLGPEERKKQNAGVFQGGESYISWTKGGENEDGKLRGRGTHVVWGGATPEECAQITDTLRAANLQAIFILLLSMTLDNLVKERIAKKAC